MELDKTKIYSLEGMNEQEVRDLFYNNGILVLRTRCIFDIKDVADEKDLISYNELFRFWGWNHIKNTKGQEIIKAKDL